MKTGQPRIVVDHRARQVTVACAICGEHQEMPCEGPLPQLIPQTSEGIRFTNICTRFSIRLGNECRYIDALSHGGHPDL